MLKYGEELIETFGKIATGYDRGLVYLEIKQAIVCDFINKIQKIKEETTSPKSKVSVKHLVNKANYLIIAMIQLRNGCRISEACAAYRYYNNKNDIHIPVTVKIAKSEKLIKVKGKKEKVKTKARYRNILFPYKWVNAEDLTFIMDHKYTAALQECKKLTNRTLDYLLAYHKCNTHSLRYAFINYLIFEKKKPLNVVAKIVGHADLNQLNRYTQQKNVDEVLNEDI